MPTTFEASRQIDRLGIPFTEQENCYTKTLGFTDNQKLNIGYSKQKINIFIICLETKFLDNDFQPNAILAKCEFWKISY